MASSDFPNSLITNTYILHDYLEIAYIVCTGTFQINIEDADARNRVLTRLRTARKQFRQASILVVLDAEKLELITFYKKADIVKDQQAILAKFGQICKQNACKIERKNACRVIDLVKPELARVWRLFSEAVLASLTLQSSTGRRIPDVGMNIYLIPEVEAVLKEDAVQRKYETRYHLRKADLQIITGGYLLLAMRDSAWPPVYALSDVLRIGDFGLREKLPVGSTLYLLPTGQLARYTGGWFGTEEDVWSWEFHPEDYDRNELRYRLCWFNKVRQWLEDHDNQAIPFGDDRMWCSAEIPVLENTDDGGAEQGKILWKPVVWPAYLTYIFLDIEDQEANIQNGMEDVTTDPLVTAQSWFNNDLSEIRKSVGKDNLRSGDEVSLAEGNLFDDDPQFGSPQQFMSAPTQTSQTNHLVYPTPPEAMNPQHTPGLSMDGIAQTPMSAHPTHPSIYQSSPLAMTVDTDASHPHESAISNFLQHNNEDLFEDEEDQKLVQPSFGDEPNWDFFDQDTTTPDMKAGVGFDDLNDSLVLVKSPENEADARPQPLQTQPAMLNNPVRSPSKDESMQSASPGQSQARPDGETDPRDLVATLSPSDLSMNFPSKIKDFGTLEASIPTTTELVPSAKRRRSSAYDVSLHPHPGRDHKYTLSGKYHFELRKSSNATKPQALVGESERRKTSTSSSSRSSDSQATSDDGGTPEKLWARYEPNYESDEPDTAWDERYDDSSYMTEIDALLEIISIAPGTEPFICPPPAPAPAPARQTMHRDTSTLKASERSFMVAQIVTEQLTHSSVFGRHEELDLPRTRIPPSFNVFVENPEFGTNISNASLGELATIQPANSNPKLTTHTVALQPDRVRLKQADSEITAELPILKFWETMNLQPLSGMKNVQALCLHPDGSNYTQGCDSFMRRMKETYTSCNLGTHERLRPKAFTATGLLAWGSSLGSANLFSLCRGVGKMLASMDSKSCTVVYVIMPGNDLSHSIEICDAFLELFEALGHVNHAPENDVVLQLVPVSFVVNADNIVVQPQKRYVELALEVYNRTPSLDAHFAPNTASAVLLEKPVGRSLQFELNSKMSSPSLRSGHCCHLAYCTSSDGRWLVASWSDTTGSIALTMPYCLAESNNGPRRPRIDVLRHMCETSMHLMGRQKGQTWLAVAKVGIYDSEELQEWLYLTQKLNDEHASISRIVILNVELQSRLTLHGLQMPHKQTNMASQPTVNNLSTPATTPQAAITSPDQAMSVTPTTSMAANAQTPPDLSTDPGAEAETYLTNPANEAWAITLAFGLNQTHNYLEIRPAMASGLLLKRLPRQEDSGGLAMISVNLIAVPRKSNTAVAFAEREQMLQDVLVQYRGLHVLAVVRGVVDDTDNCIPWHVATAYKGAKVLERLM